MLNAIENDSDINLESNDLKDGFIKELCKALIKV
jgi:hypothetical protein